MRVTPMTIEYREHEKYLHRTGKSEELSKKIKAFVDSGKSFTVTNIRKGDYEIVINRGNRFWEELGFKEINMNSTKTSKKTNTLVKKTRKKNGKVFYNCLTKRKLGFLIPTIEWVPVFTHRGIRNLKQERCYTIIIL